MSPSIHIPLIIAFLLLFIFVSKAQGGNDEHIDNSTMILWEDNYLMIELVPSENLDFVKSEFIRTEAFAREHFDGVGFTDVTEIKEENVKIKDKKIKLEVILTIFDSIGLKKYQKLMYYGMSGPTEIENPKSLMYGSYKNAIFLESKNGMIEHIWLDFFERDKLPKTKIGTALKAIGKKFDLILVDWNSNKIVSLKSEAEIENYINAY